MIKLKIKTTKTINGEKTDESPFTSPAPPFKKSKKTNEDPPSIASSAGGISNKPATPNLNNLSVDCLKLKNLQRKKQST